MSCEEMERDILLAGSGELTPEAARALDAHVSECVACRAYRQDADRLAGLATSAAGEALPGPAVMQAILAAASGRKARPRLAFARAALKPLAWAAALALLAGGWWGVTRDRSNDRIHEVTAIVAALSEREVTAAGLPASNESDHALRHLADALLLMEGLTDDESIDGEMPAEEIMPQGEPSPTVLQPHSTAAPWARRCV